MWEYISIYIYIHIINDDTIISEKSPPTWSISPFSSERIPKCVRTKLGHVHGPEDDLPSQHMRHPLRAKGECNNRLPLHRWIWWIWARAKLKTRQPWLDVCSACVFWVHFGRDDHKKCSKVFGPHLVIRRNQLWKGWSMGSTASKWVGRSIHFPAILVTMPTSGFVGNWCFSMVLHTRHWIGKHFCCRHWMTLWEEKPSDETGFLHFAPGPLW